MNDKELLELAAKAAGMFVKKNFYGVNDENEFVGIKVKPSKEAARYLTECWNPLTNDGDALRLAVKLNMGISIPIHQTIRADVVCFSDSFVNIREEGDDPYAATRRAIVRAAAEIGKQI